MFANGWRSVYKRLYSSATASTRIPRPSGIGPYMKWTPEKIAQLEECAKAGTSFSKSLLHFPDHSIPSVMCQWRRLGFHGGKGWHKQPGHQAQRWTDEQRTAVLSEFQKCKASHKDPTIGSLMNLAQDINKSPFAIFDYMKQLRHEAGVYTVNKWRPWTQDHTESACRWRQEGIKIAEIASRLSRTHETVRCRLSNLRRTRAVGETHTTTSSAGRRLEKSNTDSHS